MKILITDGETRAALAAVRSLGRRHEAWVGASDPRSLAGASRRAAGRIALPAPLAEPEAFAEAVADTVEGRGFAAILPVTDAACRALLPRRVRLAPARLAAASLEAYEALSDKARVAELAARHGLPVPRGGVVYDPDAACVVAREVGFPVVVKPASSVVAGPDGTLARRGVVRVADEAALRARIAELGREPALVQECVGGSGQGLSLLRWDGRTRAAFAHRRLREKPPGGGVSVLSESIAVDPEQQRAVEAILDDLGYEGLAMAEFKADGRQAWLMEFNARLWGSVQLAIDAGVDFPALLADCLEGRPQPAPPDYAVGRRLRWWLGDLDHALALARGAVTDDGQRGLGAALRVLVQPTGPGTRLELLRRDDPSPFALSALRWLQRRE